MKKILENIKLIWEIFSLSHSFDAKITLYEFLHGLCLNLGRVLNVIMPAWIVNLILGRERWSLVLLAAVLYGLLKCCLGGGEKSFKLLQEAHGFRACNLLRLSMNKKFMRMDYADTENALVLDSFEQAKESMWEFCDVGYVIFDDILGNLITFLCMSYILSEINILIYLLVLFLVCFNIYFQNKKNSIMHDSELKEQVMKKWCDYVSGLMQNDKVGKEIRLFHIEKFMLNKYNSYSKNYREQVCRRENKITCLSVVQAFIYFVQLIIVYLAAIQKYISGKLQIGSFLLYISSINELTESIKNLLAAFIELSKVSFYYKDYMKYMGINENLRNSGEDKVGKMERIVIEFRNVSYCYPGSKENAVNHISFVLKNKEKLGIVGENGSGKSTLIKLMLRLYDPTDGVICLNGKDIRTYDYEEYLNIFKTVFQDFSILSYSILENIVFDQNIDASKLNKILEVTGIGSYIQKYQNGLNTMVTKVLDDGGVNLSGGEEQMLAIARAFYHPCRIMVFDEPTAALDPIKEAEVFSVIKEASDDKVAVFCAHRMSSTKFCDNILVLEKGSIVESGTHSQLMKKQGKYYDMFTKQASLYKSIP